MRIVYDDTKQSELVSAVNLFLAGLDVKQFLEYEYGMERVQMYKLKMRLNFFLERYRMSIGDKVTHAHGIGNNCQYPVYFYPEGSDEIQQCGSININSGMYGEGYVSCEDYNGKRVGSLYEVTRFGVRKK